MASFLFLPMPFWMLFTSGLLPSWYGVVVFMIGTAQVLLESPDSGPFPLVMAGLGAIHAIVGGGVLYLGAIGLCYGLFDLFSPRVAMVAVGVVVTIQVVASFFPIYVLGSPEGAESFPFWEMWRAL